MLIIPMSFQFRRRFNLDVSGLNVWRTTIPPDVPQPIKPNQQTARIHPSRKICGRINSHNFSFTEFPQTSPTPSSSLFLLHQCVFVMYFWNQSKTLVFAALSWEKFKNMRSKISFKAMLQYTIAPEIKPMSFVEEFSLLQASASDEQHSDPLRPKLATISFLASDKTTTGWAVVATPQTTDINFFSKDYIIFVQILVYKFARITSLFLWYLL